VTTIQIVRLVAPEFSTVADADLTGWIELTAPMVSRKRFARLYEQALALLTCHRMKMSGLGTDNGTGTVADSMRVASYSEGDRSVSFNTSQQVNILSDAELALTTYGLQYLSIRRGVIIPITSAGEV
jgi:hypothetical protein